MDATALSRPVLRNITPIPRMRGDLNSNLFFKNMDLSVFYAPLGFAKESSFRRETGPTADHVCLGLELHLLDPCCLLERSTNDQRAPPVLDQPAALAVAVVHHPRRHLPLPHTCHHHRVLLLCHCLHHLAKGALHGSCAQVDDEVGQREDDHVPTKQLRRSLHCTPVSEPLITIFSVLSCGHREYSCQHLDLAGRAGEQRVKASQFSGSDSES